MLSNTKIENTLNIQLRSLIENGVSLEEAAQLLDLDIDAVKMALMINRAPRSTLDAEKLIEENRGAVVQALLNIGLQNDGIEYNAAVRVQALKIIYEGKGKLDEIPVNKLSEQFKKMKEVCMKYKSPEIVAGESLTSQVKEPVRTTATLTLNPADK